MIPVFKRDWKRRDQHTGLEQHVEGKIGHLEFRANEVLSYVSQQESNIDIAVGSLCSARSTACLVFASSSFMTET